MMNDRDFENELSTERIRSRMLNNAARVWGADAEDIETTFDPIVTMLIEACSGELSKINTEILSSQSRILSRLARILSPEALTGPWPSHGVANARSVDPESTLDKSVQLYANKKAPATDGSQKELTKEVFFSPTCAVRLLDGVVRFVACRQTLFETKNPLSRQHFAEASGPASLEPHVLWLGLELNPKINSLDGMGFYFDWKNDPDESKYLHLLPFNSFHLGDEPLNVVAGIHPAKASEGDPRNGQLSDLFDVSHQIESHVNKAYEAHFYTLRNAPIQGEELHASKRPYPAEFKEVFPDKALEKISASYLWIKIRFSTAFPVQAIADAYVSINSFPVCNRKLNQLTYRLQNSLNIIPLETEDLFLDIKSVDSGEGKPYIANPLSSGYNNDAGYYTLRNGGIERFDSRQSTELLNNLLELLRDESAAFSSLGNDFISGYIRQINQALALIETRIDQKGQKTKPGSFVLIKPDQADDTVFVRYWTTNGGFGNQIKSGTKLMNYAGGQTRSDSMLLLTSTFGGHEALGEGEKIIAYKKALLTHDRIVTEEDIITTCMYEIGGAALSVEVRKDWEVINQHNQGLRRIIEVAIRKNPSGNLTDEEWAKACHDLKVKIEQRSAFVLPVRVVAD